MKFRAGDKITLDGTTLEVRDADFRNPDKPLYTVIGPGKQTWTTYAIDAKLLPVGVAPSTEDDVKQPNHYQIRHTEVKDFLEELVDCIPDGPNAKKASGHLWNVGKYVLRAPYKGSFLKDLRKAHLYLGWFLELMEDKNEN